jgi:tripartite-type tricarboxylate transporter receptor subunit TctC
MDVKVLVIKPVLAALLLGAVLPPCAVAQSYPNKAIKVMVGFAAGGATDTSARMLAQKLTEQLGQPVVVENRGGSGGLIATELVSKSPPDGYTLLMMAAADSSQPALRAKMPYDLPGDFSPISLVVSGPFVLAIHTSIPARTVAELIKLARAAPSRLTYASSGVGSSAHMMGELFNSLAKIKTGHVPYKGVSQGVVAVATGEVDLIFASITAAQPLLEARKLKSLAVTKLKRTSLMPDVPTMIESGVAGYDRTGWYGMIGPANLPRDIVTKLNATIVKVVNSADMKVSFAKQGLEPDTNTPEQFTVLIKREVEQNIALARAAGIKAE